MRMGATILFIFSLLLTVKTLPNLTMSYSGYCAEEGRYYEKEELFDLVITNQIKGIRDVRIDDEKIASYGATEGYYSTQDLLNRGQTQDRPLLYASLDDFYKKNPDCCSLVMSIAGEGRPEKLSFFSRLSGEVRTVVRVFYIAGFDVRNREQALYKVIYQPISNCGKRIYIQEFSAFRP